MFIHGSLVCIEVYVFQQNNKRFSSILNVEFIHILGFPPVDHFTKVFTTLHSLVNFPTLQMKGG